MSTYSSFSSPFSMMCDNTASTPTGEAYVANHNGYGSRSEQALDVLEITSTYGPSSAVGVVNATQETSREQT